MFDVNESGLAWISSETVTLNRSDAINRNWPNDTLGNDYYDLTCTDGFKSSESLTCKVRVKVGYFNEFLTIVIGNSDDIVNKNMDVEVSFTNGKTICKKTCTQYDCKYQNNCHKNIINFGLFFEYIFYQIKIRNIYVFE